MRRQTNKKIWSWAALALLGLTLVTSVFTSRIFARYTAGTGDGESARTAGFVQVSVTPMNGNYGAWAGGGFYAIHDTDGHRIPNQVMQVTTSASETAYRLYLTVTVPAVKVDNTIPEAVNVGESHVVPIVTFDAAEVWTKCGAPECSVSASVESENLVNLSYTYYIDVAAGDAGGSYAVFNPDQSVGTVTDYDMKIADWRQYITIDKMPVQPNNPHITVTAKAEQLD